MRLGFLAGVGVSAAIVAFLSIPGHPLGTLFYNLAPPIFRSTVRWGQLNHALYWSDVDNHLSATGLCVGLGIGAGVPLGIIASRLRPVRVAATNITGIARGVPAMAVLFLMVPFVGEGRNPALIALTILALPPIFLNTAAAYGGVDRSIVEASRGMGMNRLQVLLRIETPLAAPVVVAGIRTATIEVIASATIAYFINFNTLGQQLAYAAQFWPYNNSQEALALGLSGVVAMALTAEILLSLVQRAITPASLRTR